MIFLRLSVSSAYLTTRAKSAWQGEIRGDGLGRQHSDLVRSALPLAHQAPPPQSSCYDGR